ncbi:MAG TPA: FtsQ-type POTRA domain-containing protein [Chroococcales cyanobacterium]
MRHRFLKFLLLVLFIAASAALWNLPFWRYAGLISVRGNRIVPSEEIMRKIESSELPLFRIDPKGIETRIEEIPEIEKARVRRWLFPARIEVQVSERLPFAQVASQSVFLDLGGNRFSAPFQHVPLFVVLPTPYTARAKETFRQLVALWPSEATGAIDLSLSEDLRINLRGIEVRLGKIEQAKELEEKFKTFYRLLPLAERYGNRLEYVDLRFPSAPTLKCKLSNSQTCKETGKSPLPSSPLP